jgi:hypothetical protein
VTVTAGAPTSGADLALTSGGAFAGSVRDGSGHAVNKSDVVLFNSAGDEVSDKLSSTTGAYKLTRVPAGTYAVCFYTAARFAGQCYDDVAWNERTVPAAAADLVPTAGVTTGGIDAELHT